MEVLLWQYQTLRTSGTWEPIYTTSTSSGSREDAVDLGAIPSTDGNALWVQSNVSSDSVCAGPDKVQPQSGYEWVSEWMLPNSTGIYKENDTLPSVVEDTWEYALVTRGKSVLSVKELQNASFAVFDDKSPKPSGDGVNQFVLRRRRWSRTQAMKLKLASSSSGLQRKERPLNALRMALLSQHGALSVDDIPAVSSSVKAAAVDDDVDDPMTNSMYFSAVSDDLSRSLSDEASPTTAKLSVAFISGSGAVSSDISRSNSATTAFSNSWFLGAQKAGMWMIDSSDKLLCGYTRGKGVRWRYEAVHPSTTHALDLSCNQAGHTWAVGHQGQLYVHINHKGRGETPDGEAQRTVECTCYENQRWWLSPRGWSSTMLPTDRPPWSDESGLLRLDREESFVLPSGRWSWSTPWTPVVTGSHTDDNGWQYATDFPKAYSPTARPNDVVRRRLWRRLRTITDDAPWTQIDTPTHTANGVVQRKLVRSVAVGANNVWIVTDDFRVYFRMGIVGDNHEGTEWRLIDTPSQYNKYGSSHPVGSAGGLNTAGDPVLRECHGRIAVGPTAQTWLLAPDGQVFVRKNASVSNPLGTRWQAVKGLALRDVCVGDNNVWGVGLVDGAVLFRRDVSAHRPHGKSWEVIDVPWQGGCTGLTISPSAEIVRAVTHTGTVFDRTGVSEGNLLGDGWSALNFDDLRIKRCVASGALSRTELQVAPMVRGGWCDAIRALIRERDATERHAPQFAHYHAFNDVAQITTRKRGALRWFRSSSWEVVTFVLDGTLLTYGTSGGGDRQSREVLDITNLIAICGNETGKGTEAATSPKGDATAVPDIQLMQFSVEFDSRTLVLAAETQREKEGWILSLLTAHARVDDSQKMRMNVSVSRSFEPPPSSAIWAIDANGAPWYCEKPSLGDAGGSRLLIWYAVKPYLRHDSWGCALGRFIQISSAGGLTWALGEDHCLYVSNHRSFARSEDERHTVINRMLAQGWFRVPSPVEETDGRADLLMSVSLGRGCAWATTKAGHVVVRFGIQYCVLPTAGFDSTPERKCQSHCCGTHWQRIRSETKMSRVWVSDGTVWATVATRSLLITRQGFSDTNPCGTHWALCNGLVLTEFHIDGSPEMSDDSQQSPTKSGDGRVAGIAVPPSLPPYDTAVVDVTGSNGQCFMVDQNGNLHRGAVSGKTQYSTGSIDWQEEHSGYKSVVKRDAVILWALTSGGDVHIKDLDRSVGDATTGESPSGWAHCTSVSASDPSTVLKWTCIAPNSPAFPAVKEGAVILGNSSVVACSRSNWTNQFLGLLKARDDGLANAMKTYNPNIRWNAFVKDATIGTKAITYFPMDDFWYHGRCVGSRHIDQKFSFLIGFRNAVHVWCFSEQMAWDQPPLAPILHVGMHVLFSVTNWKGHVRFARGEIVEIAMQHSHGEQRVARSLADALSSDGGVGDALQPRDAPTDRDPSAGHVENHDNGGLADESEKTHSRDGVVYCIRSLREEDADDTTIHEVTLEQLRLVPRMGQADESTVLLLKEHKLGILAEDPPKRKDAYENAQQETRMARQQQRNRMQRFKRVVVIPSTA